jgi:hypothetical protein
MADPDASIDRLYAASPDEFVKRRDELARSLRKDGEREAADEVKKLRKPSVAAWTVNQLARREKMRLRGLFTAGERLRAAQEQVLAGEAPDVLERARDDERAAIRELAGPASALLEEAGHPPTEAMLDRVRETLHAAVVDEDIGGRVRAGRLEKEEQVTGFAFTSLPTTTAKPKRPPARSKPAQKPAKDTAAAAKRRRAQEDLKAARDALAEAEKILKGRERELEQASREVERRRSAVERAERAVERGRSVR